VRSAPRELVEEALHHQRLAGTDGGNDHGQGKAQNELAPMWAKERCRAGQQRACGESVYGRSRIHRAALTETRVANFVTLPGAAHAI
jgi:hypothetical protein